jgi:predicted ABC-type ATPase
MPTKRLRVFAGPNGSGKSSLINQIQGTVPVGFYINPDAIERKLIHDRQLSLIEFGVVCKNSDLKRFIRTSSFVKSKSNRKVLTDILQIENNILFMKDDGGAKPKYLAAIVADFLRLQNLKLGNDFSFETVLSHPEKIQFLKKAKKAGHKIYLYFVCIDDVRVNIERVKSRFKQGGHNVPESKIRERYTRTLELLFEVLKVCYKAYLFDNSGNTMYEVARLNRDGLLYINEKWINETAPIWFTDYVVNKAKH